MPTPFGHTLMGAILYDSTRMKHEKISWFELMMFIIVANLADMDYIPGYIFGNPNLFHHSMTHSVFFALVISISVAYVYYIVVRKEYIKIWFLMSITYISHLIMDYFGKDTSYPYGEQLFWPLSSNYFLSPFSIFNDVHKASSSKIFIQSLFNWHNLMTIIQEIIILLPVFLTIEYLRKRNQRSI